MPAPPQDLRDIETLLAIMRALRAPGGCPWDREQTFETIAPYTIEEAYEVAQAIEDGDRRALKAELGDLLFQVVYHAQMAAEEGSFQFVDVVEAIADKLVRRHPHVFGDANIKTADEQTRSWEAMKAEERDARGAASLMDDVPRALPALLRAQKLQARAARSGFEWVEFKPILAKLAEETAELTRAVEAGKLDEVAAEFGDVLFVMVNLARRLDVDPENALRLTNAKFERRFRFIEDRCAASGRAMTEVPLEELESLWREAKIAERPIAKTD
jgi:tetrapyrrole methylase family protein/MazG family protein/ATP diphosphatase